MLINKLLRVKRELLRKLQTITKQSGAQYTPVVKSIEDLFSPQSDVEITLQALGYDYVDPEESAIQFTDVDLRFQIDILVSRRIASDSTPIDEICLAVCSDIETTIMDDITQDGNCYLTQLETVSASDQQIDGYYYWSISFYCRTAYEIDQPNSA